MNLGDGTFFEAGVVFGLDSIRDGRGLAAADYDRDGDVDFVINNYRAPAQLFVNQIGQRRAWLAVRLEGKQSNRDGIGAEITVRAGGRQFLRVVSAGHGYVGQNSLEQLFGLGDADLVEWVQVRWPSGLTERFGSLQISLEPRQRLRLVEGSGQPLATTPHPPRVTARPSGDPAPWVVGLIGLLVAFLVARPGLV